ncbi:hypothetical protein D3C86_1060690 [compost metagenome]
MVRSHDLERHPIQGEPVSRGEDQGAARRKVPDEGVPLGLLGHGLDQVEVVQQEGEGGMGLGDGKAQEAAPAEGRDLGAQVLEARADRRPVAEQASQEERGRRVLGRELEVVSGFLPEPLPAQQERALACFRACEQ